MKRIKLYATLTTLLMLCGMTACAPQPQADAAPEEDVIIAITDPPTTEPPTTIPTTEEITETEEPEDQLEPMNSAEEGQAYLAIADSSWYNQYWGNSAETDLDPTGWFLAYDAGVTDIAGNGTYKVSVNADSKGFRLASTDNIEGTNIPQGLSFLSVVIRDGADIMPDAIITIDKIRVDGKTIDLIAKNITAPGEDRGSDEPCLQAVICDPNTEELPRAARCEDGDVADQDDAEDYAVTIVDPEDFESWQKVEVTFTISGLEDFDNGSNADDAETNADDEDSEDEESEDDVETTGEDE